jgi:hypothetical protein
MMALALMTAGLLLGTGPAGASTGAGWVRLAHLSPNTPAVDVYLYNFGDPSARLVLHHVSYGNVSPYEQLPPGDYTVAMRATGATASSPPVLSTAFWVTAGDAYTVAGMGPLSGLRLQVMKDALTAPPGRALVRVIQASLRQQAVSVSLGGQPIAPHLTFATTTSYQAVAPGHRTVTAVGDSERASLDLDLAPDTTYTLTVLDGQSGLRIAALDDAVGSRVMPVGGADTGLGGTAPLPAPSPLPWLCLLAAGLLLAGAGQRLSRRANRNSKSISRTGRGFRCAAAGTVLWRRASRPARGRTRARPERKAKLSQCGLSRLIRDLPLSPEIDYPAFPEHNGSRTIRARNSA